MHFQYDKVAILVTDVYNDFSSLDDKRVSSKKKYQNAKRTKEQFLGHMDHPLTPHATTPAAAATLPIFTHIVWRDENGSFVLFAF